jgi:hypothetical protein
VKFGLGPERDQMDTELINLFDTSVSPTTGLALRGSHCRWAGFMSSACPAKLPYGFLPKLNSANLPDNTNLKKVAADLASIVKEQTGIELLITR